MTNITQHELKLKLNYDPDTGYFTWLSPTSHRIKIGQVVKNLRNDGYIQVGINNKRYLCHRLAWFYMYGFFPTEIDHINGIRSDNRLINLREVTSQENKFNTPKFKNNKSGFKGVYWCRSHKKWVADARLNKKHIFLGHHETAKQASDAYQDFARKNHGDFKNEREIMQ